MKPKLELSIKNKEHIEKFKDNAVKKIFIAIQSIFNTTLLFIVYAFALLCEYLLFKILGLTLKSSIEKFSNFSLFFEYLEFGVGLLTLCGYLCHSIFSIVSQVKFEKDISENDKNQ